MDGLAGAVAHVGAAPTASADAATVVVLAVSGVASLLLTGLAVAAYSRRRSTSYLLVALAVATLLARTGVAWAALANRLAPDTHHLLEHALDVAMIVLVVAAVYYARTVAVRGEAS